MPVKVPPPIKLDSTQLLSLISEDNRMSFTIIGSSYTSDVYTFYFEGDSLALISSVEVGFHPSWIAFHPEDRSLIFAGLEQDEGKIIAIKYDAELKGAVVAESSSGGKDPCSVVVVKDELLIANVGSLSSTRTFYLVSYNACSIPVDRSLLSRCPRTRHTYLRIHLSARSR